MQDYHSIDDALTRSALSLFLDNPQDFYLQYVAKTVARKEPTARMELGTLLHSILLEKIDPFEAIAIYPETCLKSDGGLNPKPVAHFREDNPDSVCLKVEAAERVTMAVSAFRHSAIGPILAGNYHFEQAFYGDVSGVRIKCKPDIAGAVNDRAVCYDLKVVEDDFDGLFHRTSKRLKYWLQDAHYSAIMSQVYEGLPTEFAFFTLRMTPPFRVRMYSYDILSRESAATKHRAGLAKYADYLSRDYWPDEYDGTLVLDPWDANADIEGNTDGDI